MKSSKVLWLAVLGLLLLVPSAWARQGDTARAVLAIDLNLDGLAALGLGNVPEGLAAGSLNGADLQFIKQVSRFTLFMSAPENIEALAETQGDAKPIPFEIFVRIDFKNGEARQKLIDSMKEGIEEVTVNGQKVFKPTKIGPPNLRLKLIGDKSVEMGTETFIASKDRKFMSPQLEATWNAAPKHAFRLAADLEPAAALIDSALAGASEEIPRAAKPFVALIPKISTLRLTVDGKDTTLLSLSIDGKDEAAADELFEGLEGVLGMAKMAATEGIKQLQENSPKMAVVAGEIVKALNSKKTGHTVALSIPRPAGLSDAISEAIGTAQEASQENVQFNRMRQAALAVHNFDNAYGQFPFLPLKDSAKAGGNLSWRVRVLPFIEQMELSKKIDLSQDFDSPANAAFAESMPELLGVNSSSHSDIVWVQTKTPVAEVADILDGTSNTIMFVQHPAGVPWMDPTNVSPDDVVKRFLALKDDEKLLVAFYDGSVHRLSRKIDVAEIKKMLDPADGQAVSVPRD